MKRFNPEKELSKIRNGNKKKVIISICALLVVGILGYSFALYQVRHTQKLVFNTVGEFKKRDIYLSVLVDGETKSEFPGRDDGYVFERLDCDKDGTSATFDKESWELVLRTNKPNKCTVVFGTKPNEPELYQGLIPVTIDDDGTIKVADTDSEWYDYGEHKWANAVLVTSAKYNDLIQDNQIKEDKIGTTLNLDSDVLQMYVWIPRYKYQLFNVNRENMAEQEIKVQFERDGATTGEARCTIEDNGAEKCTDAINGNWYTHPAFTFGSTNLNGFWMGKFESSGTENAVTIKPNIYSLRNLVVSKFFAISHNIGDTYASNFNLKKEEIDTHLTKNSEWGAMAYLTQSAYGRCDGNGNCVEVTRNGKSGYITGYDNTDNTWNTEQGVKASTTGNVYGIYDVSGGSWEYVMGNMVNEEGEFYTNGSEFVEVPDTKYYDKYEYASNMGPEQKDHLGDAIKETINDVGQNESYLGWYKQIQILFYNEYSWYVRGGRFDEGAGIIGSGAGIFACYRENGRSFVNTSFRVIISKTDG